MQSFRRPIIVNSRHSVKLFSTNPSSGLKFEGRRYTGYNIYKGKGAIAIRVIPPTWSQQGSKSFVLSREGGLLFEFAPSTGTQREYDWSKKANFFLDVTECGEVLNRGATGCDFVHDPGALTDTAGQVTKKMRWSPTPDNKGVYVGLTVAEKANPAGFQLSLPVSWSEFMVIDSLIRFCIPRFLGIDQCFAPPGTVYAGSKDEVAPVPPPAPAYLPLE